MRDRMLFLFGGNPSLFEANQEFITAAGGKNSRIALLIVNTPGYQKYIPAYTNVWRQIGISAYSIIVPDDQGQLDFDTTEKVLLNATGIYIGGGDTRTYLKLYASDPIKGMLKTCYQNGIPIAGCSAGALILMERCMLTPDIPDQDGMEMHQGIGLLTDMILTVHHTEMEQKGYLLQGMRATNVQIGYGIDEEACAIFQNGTFVKTIGNSVHSVRI